MTNSVTIQHGPFKNHVVPQEHLRVRIEEDRIIGFWPHSERLALFFERYQLADGWGFKTEKFDEDLEITTREEINGVVHESGPHKTMRFVAHLTRNEKIQVTASTLYPMNVVKAYESGENNALSRLLDHLGLPAVFVLSSPKDLQLNGSQSNGNVTETIGVTLVSTPNFGKSNSTQVVLDETASTANAGDSTQDKVVDADKANTAPPAVDAVEPQTTETPQASTPAAATATVSRNLRMQLLNLHRKHCRGTAFEEPTSNDHAQQRINELMAKEKDAAKVGAS